MTPTGRAPVLTVRAVLLIVAVLIGIGLGGWRTTSMAAAKPDPSTLVVNGVSYTVAHVEQVKGLSSSELGGMAHGIQSLVSDDKAMVKVTLVVSAGDSPIQYDASVLQAFSTGSSAGVLPAGGTLAPGRLSAHARIEGSLSFVVPRNGAQISLRAPDSSREILLLVVDKVTVDKAPAGEHQPPHGTAKPKDPAAAKPKSPSGTAEHQHSSSTPTPGGTSPLNRP